MVCAGGDGLEVRIVQHIVDHVVQVDQLKVWLQLPALQPGDGQDALQHGVQLNRVLLEAIEHLVALGLIGVARNRQGQPHARDRRAQFMRDAAQQIAFALNLIAQLTSHDVEVAYQVGDFVLAIAEIFSRPDIEIAARQLMSGVAQALDGLGQVVRDQQTNDRRE